MTKSTARDRRQIDPASPRLPAVLLTVLWLLGFCQLLLSHSAARGYALAVAGLLAAVLALTLWIWYGTKLSCGARFALTALGFGSVMLFAMAPLAPPDELAHYQNTLRCLSLLFGREFPASLFDYTGLSGHFNVSSGYLRVWQELFRPWPSGGETLILNGGVAYFPEYIPQTVGVGAGLLLHRDFVTLLLSGRFTNLVFYCLCVYLALRRTPVYRELLGMAALLPMALHQAASLSYDAFIMGLSLIYTASIFRSRESTGLITRGELGWIAVPGVLLAPTRAVYIVLALLFFLIPRERFPSGKRRALCFVLLLGACAVLTAGFQAETMADLGGDGLNWEGRSNYTLGDIFADLPGTVRIFALTLLRNCHHWVSQAHGSTLAGLSLPMPRWVAWGFGLLLLSTALDRAPRERVKKPRERLLVLLVLLLAVGGTMLAMLLAWTSVGRQEIQGVQGRYFLPVFPLGYWMLSASRPLLRERTAPLLAPVTLALLTGMVLYILNYTAAF